jgi:hypothetical protein
MAEKRARKAEEEAKEARANEAIRRKTTKDMNAIKEELKAKEAIRDAEKKRQGFISFQTLTLSNYCFVTQPTTHQKKSMTLRPKQPSRLRLKLTNVKEQKKPRAKRPFARVDP